MTVRFLTPTRTKAGGKLVSKPKFHHLVRSLLRRLQALATHHCGTPLSFDPKELISLAESAVRTAGGEVRWLDLKRFSTRQRARLKMGGVVGTLVFEGDLEPFLPFGEELHVGKGAVFGFGKIALQKEPSNSKE